MPWVRTRVFLLTRIDIDRYRSKAKVKRQNEKNCATFTFLLLTFSLNGTDDLLRRLGHGLGGNDRESRVGQNFPADLDVGALHPHHQRNLDAELARGLDHALSEHVAAH